MAPRVYSNGRALSFHSPLLYFEVAQSSIKPRAIVEHTRQFSAEVPVGRFVRGGASELPSGVGASSPHSTPTLNLLSLWNTPGNSQPKCPQGASDGVERPTLPRGLGASSPHSTPTLNLLSLWNTPGNSQPKCP